MWDYSISVPITDQLIENVRDKVLNEKKIAKDKQRLYYEGEPLQRPEFREGDILFVEDADNPTTERDWSIVVCGDFDESPITVLVPYPSYLTDLGLKKLVHREKDTLPVANQTLYHEGGDVLPKGKPLKTCEFWGNGVMLFVEDTRKPTTERDWSIVVCGDFDESPITVLVPYPSYLTDLGLKKLVHQKKHTLPVANQTLYHEGDVLPQGKPLKTCGFWDNGVILFVEDADNPTTERDWSIVVCSDFDESRITVSVPFPSYLTDLGLKKLVHQKKNTLPVANQTLYHEGGDVLPKGKPLKTCEFWGNGVMLFVEDTRKPTTERDWSIVVCGDFDESPITVLVPYPSYLTDLGLKKLVHQKKHTLPVANQTLYHEGDVLPQGKPLKTCGFWDNGVILFVEDADNPTTERDWSIVVCSDFDESHITVSVPFPSYLTDLGLKKLVHQKKNTLPVANQTLYHEGGDVLPKGKPLKTCEFWGNGVMLFVEVTCNPTEERNWTVDVYGYSNGSLVKVVVSVPYPSYLTDLGLKKLVHQKLNTLPIDDLILYHEGKVLPEGKPLKTCKSWIDGVTVVVKDTHIELTTEREWSIVVCGDFDDSPITVSVLFPFLTTVAVLKKSIENEIKVPIKEQTLYYKAKILQDNKSLVECDLMKNGAAVYLAIKPFKINVYRPDKDVFVVEIPQKELPHWKVLDLRKIVCSKSGFDVKSPHVLAVAGKKLTNDMMIKDQPEIKDGCNVTFTVLQCATLETPEDFDDRILVVPVDSSFNNISKEALYQRELRYGPDSPVKSQSPSASSWTISVQLTRKCMCCSCICCKNRECQLSLKECQSTPVFKLRELIRDKLSILPHQQKLTAGTTVLEDWDEDGKVLLLCNYPSIYDGVTIELVRVAEGVYVKLSDYDDKKSLRISQTNVIPSSTKPAKICPPEYINIHNPEKMTVHTLMNIMENCGEDISEGKIYKQNRFACAWGCARISKNSVQSVKSISNGCMLMKTTKPSGWLDRKSKKKEQKETKSRK